ncbi:MAG TPA: AAA family ATPase [Sedimentisphaerales bacterium]|nr:AAA family ATPase [Sedimentisphaerales bacterium]
MTDEIRGIVAGRITNLPLPWPLLEELGQMFTPGSKTALVAPGGASKSLWAMLLVAYWIDEGIRVACLELERGRTFHLRRSLSQRTGIADVTKNKWVAAHADEVQRMLHRHADFLNKVGLAIHIAPRSFSTHDAADWLADRAAEGCRAAVIDPVTCLRRLGDIWAADDEFLGACDRIATESGMSLLFVTHPKKGGGSAPNLDSLAGGSAYARFCDSAVWLEAHDPRESVVRTCCGNDSVMHNRTLHLLKTRSGEGTGLKLAFDFSAAKGLVLHELGILATKKRKDRTL